MTNIIALNQELNAFGISLHKRTVEVLIGEIEEAIAAGLIRSKDDQYSIFDFLRVLLGDKAERKTWKRFVETDSNTVAFCHSVKFDRKDGKLANAESPATNLFGLVYLAYMSPGDYSHQLRRSSALYFVESRKNQHSLNSVTTSDALETESRKIAELTDLLKDWEAKYKQVYDKMQYHQARAMGNDMLTRLKEKPEVFSEDSDLLWLISGLASKSYFVGRCREDLEYGVDYINGARKGTIKLTPYAALQMLLNFRSKKGVQVRYLPETVEVAVKKSIGSDGLKINRRKMQQS